MILHAATEHGTYAVDVEADEVAGLVGGGVSRSAAPTGLPRVVAADAVGATVIAVVEARPPLMVSHDAGATWQEAGGGLPAGFDVALHPGNPDLVAYAARNRLYVSRDGGRFWSALTPELPAIQALAWEAETG